MDWKSTQSIEGNSIPFEESSLLLLTIPGCLLTNSGNSDIPSIWVLFKSYPAISRIVGPKSIFATSICKVKRTVSSEDQNLANIPMRFLF